MTAAPVLARSLKYTVSVSRGEGAGKVFLFEKPVVAIGRGPENELVFANDPKISRTHAEFRVQMGQLYIKNLSERNFILVNGERVDQKLLTGSSEIQVGETILTVNVDSGPPSPSHLILAKQHSVMTPLVAKSTTEMPYQQPFSPPPISPSATKESRGRPSPASVSSSGALGNPRVRFYLVIAIVAGLAWWLLSGGINAKKPEVNLRTEGDVARAIEDSANAVRELKKQQQNTGKDSLQYKAAQEHYLKGFRDYRQGQYARARQSFEAALSFYPTHELAGRYKIQADRKFEGMVNQSMSQGRKYYQKQNFKMCQSAFANVMIMLRDSTKKNYQEAKQLYEECRLRMEGRF